mmetsp:Transcript_1193/g.3798  ORF Transcript_1193/g.3798 Transcript_1193/m.3798 type:complete len:370 (-) Transcript_1193:135-1244(-)
MAGARAANPEHGRRRELHGSAARLERAGNSRLCRAQRRNARPPGGGQGGSRPTAAVKRPCSRGAARARRQPRAGGARDQGRDGAPRTRPGAAAAPPGHLPRRLVGLHLVRKDARLVGRHDGAQGEREGLERVPVGPQDELLPVGHGNLVGDHKEARRLGRRPLEAKGAVDGGGHRGLVHAKVVEARRGKGGEHDPVEALVHGAEALVEGQELPKGARHAAADEGTPDRDGEEGRLEGGGGELHDGADEVAPEDLEEGVAEDARWHEAARLDRLVDNVAGAPVREPPRNERARHDGVVADWPRGLAKEERGEAAAAKGAEEHLEEGLPPEVARLARRADLDSHPRRVTDERRPKHARDALEEGVGDEAHG